MQIRSRRQQGKHKISGRRWAYLLAKIVVQVVQGRIRFSGLCHVRLRLLLDEVHCFLALPALHHVGTMDFPHAGLHEDHHGDC